MLQASNGHEACVDALLHNGADVTCRAVRDRTPLHMAAMCGHVLVLTVLIEVLNSLKLLLPALRVLDFGRWDLVLTFWTVPTTLHFTGLRTTDTITAWSCFSTKTSATHQTSSETASHLSTAQCQSTDFHLNAILCVCFKYILLFLVFCSQHQRLRYLH